MVPQPMVGTCQYQSFAALLWAPAAIAERQTFSRPSGHASVVNAELSYMGKFAKGGRLFEDNGGLPELTAGEAAARQAQSMQQPAQNALTSSQPWQQQQAGCMGERHRSRPQLSALDTVQPLYHMCGWRPPVSSASKDTVS